MKLSFKPLSPYSLYPYIGKTSPTIYDQRISMVLFKELETLLVGLAGAEGKGPRANKSSLLKVEYYAFRFLALYFTL